MKSVEFDIGMFAGGFLPTRGETCFMAPPGSHERMRAFAERCGFHVESIRDMGTHDEMRLVYSNCGKPKTSGTGCLIVSSNGFVLNGKMTLAENRDAWDHMEYVGTVKAPYIDLLQWQERRKSRGEEVEGL